MIQEFLQRLAARLDIPGFPWKNLVIGFSLGQFCFKSWLLYRQFRVYQRRTIPKPLAKEVSQETFNKSQEYGTAKAKFGFVSSLIAEIQSNAVLYYNVLPLVWSVSGSIVRSFSSPRFSGELTQTVVFMILQSVIDLVTSAPLEYYQHFVMEQAFGFNKMTVGLWIKDSIKKLALSAALVGPLAAGCVAVVKQSGPSFFYNLWVFAAAIQLIALTIMPILITPLFNKVQPLPDGKLKSNLEALCRRVKFPLDKLQVIDGSTRSSHSNAYFTGPPWKKQIVLYDTLVESSHESEIEGVLAHEIGHWYLNHLVKGIAIAQIYTFGIFAAWSSFTNNQSLFSSFGFPYGEKPVIIGLMLFSSISDPINVLVSLGRNMMTRSMEYEADQYAVSLGYKDELARALVRLQIDNLSHMDADSLYSSFHFSHPILSERLSAIGWVNDGEPVVSHEEQRQKKVKKEVEAVTDGKNAVDAAKDSKGEAVVASGREL